MGLFATLFKKKKKKKEALVVDATDDLIVGESDKQITTMEEAIRDWQETVKLVQQHPLSQVKIINTRILEDISNLIRQMNSKLDRLEELDKLDVILLLLKETRDELKKKGVEAPKLEKAITQMESITLNDKDLVDWIASVGKATANEAAEKFGLSRSTVSFKLNRLVDKGVLTKAMEGKHVYFSVVNKEERETTTSGQPTDVPSISSDVQSREETPDLSLFD